MTAPTLFEALGGAAAVLRVEEQRHSVQSVIPLAKTASPDTRDRRRQNIILVANVNVRERGYAKASIAHVQLSVNCQLERVQPRSSKCALG